MSELSLNSSALSTPLKDLLSGNDDIQPGSDPSYQLCKIIYEYHPLGAKMAKYPVSIALSQERQIEIPKAPPQAKEAFFAEWKRIAARRAILNTTVLSRVYGVASLIMLAEGRPSNEPIDPRDYAKLELSFNVLDPLNTAGSLVLNQNPNALDFQKHDGVMAQGQTYDRKRAVTIMNEEPIYLGYTSSAFGYVGRSVYQRALFPLKSFVQSMVTDDLVIVKAGVIVATMKAAGSIVTNIMQQVFASKRNVVKEAQTGNVISIGDGEKIESLNLQNLEAPFKQARMNALQNIASAADMPAKLLDNETFAEGFGEGSEDAKAVAQYVDELRQSMQPLYDFFDEIVQYRAWNESFYETIQGLYPDEFGKVPYERAFDSWRQSFSAVWPSLLTEPESEKVKTDDVKLKAVIGILEVLLPTLDPENKAALIQWAEDNVNQNKHMFGSPLMLDYESLASYEPLAATMPGVEEEQTVPKPAPPESKADAQRWAA